MSDGTTLPEVELVYDDACPHVEEARISLRRALIAEGWAPKWREWERSDASAPRRVRAFGSPTVLVRGRDVLGPGQAEAQGNCCRLYPDAAGRLAGAPTVAALRTGLRRERDGA